ncbi:MAG TPA: glycosyltransferase family 39 protein [bacterium]|nr:glycosyltransferase family 39 protein [bacterium]
MTSEQRQTHEPETKHASTAPVDDETFDFVDAEEEAPHRFSRLFWLQWIVLFFAGFFLLSILNNGFAAMHRYGWSETGISWSILIPKSEKVFALALLAMLPAAVFMIFAFEDLLRKTVVKVGNWLFAPGRVRILLPTLLVVAAVAIFCCGRFILDDRPITDDENVYLFQSRILAAGHLTLPSLPDQAPLQDRLFEDNVFFVNNGKIFGQYPLGQSILLLPTLLMGYPRLMTLLAALATIVAIFLLGRRLYGPKLGFIAAFLLTISPTFLTTSATLLSHPATMCFLAWFYFFAHRTWKDDRWWDALLAGVFFFLAFQVRSTTALLAAGPAGLALAYVLFRDVKKQWPKIVILAALVVLTLAATFALNYAINGDIFKTNYHAAWGEGRTPFKHPFGFGKGTWHIVHEPTTGLTNMVNNLLRLNWWLLGWPVSLLFVLAWLLKRDKKTIEWIGFSSVVLTFGVYFFYFWPGVSDTGPVLYYELSIILLLLTVSGFESAVRLLMYWMPRAKARRRLALFVVFSCVISFVTFHQYQARALARVGNNVGQFEKVLEQYDVPERAVVFTNYYLKGTKDYNFQDSWVVGRPATSRLLNDRRLYYVNYGRSRDEEFMKKYHPDLPAYVITWLPSPKSAEDGVAEVVKLAEYTVDFLPDNFPDSR